MAVLFYHHLTEVEQFAAAVFHWGRGSVDIF